MWLDTLTIETYLIQPDRLRTPLKYLSGPDDWCFPISDFEQVNEVMKQYPKSSRRIAGGLLIKGQYETFVDYGNWDDIDYFWGGLAYLLNKHIPFRDEWSLGYYASGGTLILAKRMYDNSLMIQGNGKSSFFNREQVVREIYNVSLLFFRSLQYAPHPVDITIQPHRNLFDDAIIELESIDVEKLLAETRWQ